MAKPLTSEGSKLSVISTDSPFEPPEPPLNLPSLLRQEWFDLVRYLHRNDNWNDQKSGIAETYLTNLHLMRMAHCVPGLPIDSAAVARHSGVVTRLATLLGLDAKSLTPKKQKSDSAWIA